MNQFKTGRISHVSLKGENNSWGVQSCIQYYVRHTFEYRRFLDTWMDLKFLYIRVKSAALLLTTCLFLLWAFLYADGDASCHICARDDTLVPWHQPRVTAFSGRSVQLHRLVCQRHRFHYAPLSTWQWKVVDWTSFSTHNSMRAR